MASDPAPDPTPAATPAATPAWHLTGPIAIPVSGDEPYDHRSPYPGLRPFTHDEGNLFFGRETQIDAMLQRLKQTRFLAVVGASGCGKSSLVRAGLLVALETGLMGMPEGARWRFAVMRPGSRPMESLAESLMAAGFEADGGSRDVGLSRLTARLRTSPLGLIEAMGASRWPERTNCLVLVDQFEEIFRFRREGDRDEAEKFVALLLQSFRYRELPIYVVLTMRSDFIGNCAHFTGLPEAINDSQYLTPKLSREQQRDAIVGPARVREGAVEEALVNRLLNEINRRDNAERQGNEGAPDQLPVLAHLLMRMWTLKAERTPRNRPVELTMADYEDPRVGGLDGALSRHADRILDGLDAADRPIAEAMFRRLSEIPGNLRRPTEADELARVAGVGLADVIRVAEPFRAPGANFLSVDREPIDPTTKLDISHESLIRQWQALRGWAKEEAEFAETYRNLALSARLHREGKAGLLDEDELRTYCDWRQKGKPNATWARRYGGDYARVIAFLDASVDRRQQEVKERQREAAQKLEAQRREMFLWRLAAGVFGVLFLLSIVLGQTALRLQQAAATQRAVALAGQADRAAAEGDTPAAIDKALKALPRQAVLVDAVREVVDRPFDAFAYRTLAAAAGDFVRWPTDPTVYRAFGDWLFRPEQPEAVAALERGVLQPAGRVFGRSQDQATVTSLAFSAASGMLIAGISSPADGGQIQRRQRDPRHHWRPPLPPLAYPPQPPPGRPQIATATAAQPAADRPALRPQQVTDVGLSGDGRFLIAVGNLELATIRDAASGEERVRWFINEGNAPARQDSGGSIAIVADPGRPGIHRIISGPQRGKAAIWEWDEATPDQPPVRTAVLADPADDGRTHSVGVTAVALSADGRRAATASWDGVAKVWDAGTGEPLFILNGHDRPIRSIQFSPVDGGRLVTASHDRSVRLWCTHPPQPTPAAGAADQPRPCVAPRPAAGADAAAVPAPVPRDRPRPVAIVGEANDALRGHGREVISAVFDPAGERVASASLDGSVRVWDVGTGELKDVLQGPVKVGGRDAVVRFVDDRTVAAAFADARTFVWSVQPTPLRPRPLPTATGFKAGAIDAQDRRLAVVRALRGDRPCGDGAGDQEGDGEPACRYRVEVWNLADAGADARPVRRTDLGRTPVDDIRFSPDGRLLLARVGGTLRLWSANVWRDGGGDAPGVDPGLATLTHGAQITGVAFAADGRRMLTASVDGTAQLWDLGRLLAAAPPAMPQPVPPLGLPLRHRAAVDAAWFDPAGHRIVTASADGTARIWDSRTTQPTSPPLPHPAPVVAAAFSSDGRTLATLAASGQPMLWSVPDGRRRWTDDARPAPGYADGACGRPEMRPGIAFVGAETIEVSRWAGGATGCTWVWSSARPTDPPAQRQSRSVSGQHLLKVGDGVEVFSRLADETPIARLSQLRQPLARLIVGPSGGTIAAVYAGGDIRILGLPASDPKRLIRYAQETVLPALAHPPGGG